MQLHQLLSIAPHTNASDSSRSRALNSEGLGLGLASAGIVMLGLDKEGLVVIPETVLNLSLILL